MVDNVESYLLPIVLACALSLVLSSGSLVWCALFSAPASQRRAVDNAIATACDAVARVDRIEMGFVQHKIDTEGILESVEGVLSSVEKKRRRVAGAESRLNAGTDPEPQTRADIVAAARTKIYGV